MKKITWSKRQSRDPPLHSITRKYNQSKKRFSKTLSTKIAIKILSNHKTKRKYVWVVQSQGGRDSVQEWIQKPKEVETKKKKKKKVGLTITSIRVRVGGAEISTIDSTFVQKYFSHCVLSHSGVRLIMANNTESETGRSLHANLQLFSGHEGASAAEWDFVLCSHPPIYDMLLARDFLSQLSAVDDFLRCAFTVDLTSPSPRAGPRSPVRSLTISPVW